jgi:hypothetical protein
MLDRFRLPDTSQSDQTENQPSKQWRVDILAQNERIRDIPQHLGCLFNTCLDYIQTIQNLALQVFVFWIIAVAVAVRANLEARLQNDTNQLVNVCDSFIGADLALPVSEKFLAQLGKGLPRKSLRIVSMGCETRGEVRRKKG